MSEMPFLKEIIPVCFGLDQFETFIDGYPGFCFCPYVADKDSVSWKTSTSRKYMNKVLPNFLYIPVNIEKGNQAQLRGFFERMNTLSSVVAVNITQPHKSNAVLTELYLKPSSSLQNIDTLIRSESGLLEPFDLNSVAFVEWYKNEVGSFKDREVVLVGAGGVGEPIAKRIAELQPSSLTIVDPSDKRDLLSSLKGENTYLSSLDKYTSDSKNLILINAAGKEGGTDPNLQSTLERCRGVFVDIRPHLLVDEVELAKQLGWEAYTGHGMNARNDYELLRGIAKNMHVSPPEYLRFEALVAAAS
jgi:shikimate 5-dehydrogenase